MVNVSTLFYVLENLEGKRDEIYDLEEIHELERKYMDRLFGILDQAKMEIRPSIIQNILQTTSSEN